MKSNEQLPRFACTSVPTGGFGGDGFDGGAERFAMELEVGQVFRSFLSAMYTGIWQIDSLVVVYVGRRVFDIYNVVTRHGGVYSAKVGASAFKHVTLNVATLNRRETHCGPLAMTKDRHRSL